MNISYFFYHLNVTYFEEMSNMTKFNEKTIEIILKSHESGLNQECREVAGLNFPALRGRGFANQKIYFGILLPRRPSEF